MLGRRLVSGFVIGLFAACSSVDQVGKGTANDPAPGADTDAGDGGGAPGSGGTSGGGTAGSGGVGPVDRGSGGAGTGGVLPDDPAGGIAPPTRDDCDVDESQFAGAPDGGPLLYPYDDTLFPRHLGGPVLMWTAKADRIYVQAKSKRWSYTDCPTTSDGTRFKIEDSIWGGADYYTEGPSDPVTIAVTIVVNGRPTARFHASVRIAGGGWKGAVYYDTYGAPGSVSAGKGSVMKLLPGDRSPKVFPAATSDSADGGASDQGTCRSCHSVSANGATMTSVRIAPKALHESEIYDLSGFTPVRLAGKLPETGFGGVFPDGSRILTSGNPNAAADAFFPTADGNVPGLLASTTTLVDARTGAAIAMHGWDAPHAQMPMFSPTDGRRVVYNDHDGGGGHSLTVADFDPVTNTFSGQRRLFSDPELYPSWPSFTPDAKSVLFSLSSRSDYASQLPDTFGKPSLSKAGRGHLMIVNVETALATSLDAANGWKAGRSTLPAGAARDNDLEFYPSVSPVAGGGYFWAFFTSRRTYGNLGTLDIDDPRTKKIWVTAISINADADAGIDPSHPAFFLPGQEVDTGNMRAFSALEPCMEDGQSCTGGSECCAGVCSQRDPVIGIGICGSVEAPTCPKYNDRCATESDCCVGVHNGAPRDGDKLYCLGGFCDLKSQG